MNEADIQWQTNMLSENVMKGFKYPSIFGPIFLFFLFFSLGILLPKGKIIAFSLAVVLPLFFFIIVRLRFLHFIIKLRYSEKGIYYVMRNGGERFVLWDEVKSIKSMRKYPDYELWFHKRNKMFAEGHPIGKDVGITLQTYWHQYLKKKEQSSVR